MTHFRPVAGAATLLRHVVHLLFTPVTVAAVAAGVLLASALGTAHADTFKQLNVIINQLDAADVPTAEDRQKDMNVILKQCDAYGVHIRVTITKTNPNQDPKDDGDSIAPDGKVPNDAAANKLDKVGLDGEIKNGGYKVWVGKEVKSGGSVCNGSTVVGTASSVVREQSGIDGDERTWTHEMGHGLGLKHDDPGVDEDNLIYPSRRKPSPPNPADTPAGTVLTKAQCTTMAEYIEKLRPSTDKTESQKAEPPAKAPKTSMVDPTDSPPLQGTTADIDHVAVVVDSNLINPDDNSIYVRIDLNATIATVPATVYLVMLDVDNNAATGDPDGFDALLEEHLTSYTSGDVLLWPWPPGTSITLDPLTVESTVRSVSGPDFGFEVPAGTALSSRVSLSLLKDIYGLEHIADPIPVMIKSVDGPLTDFVGPELVTTVPPDEPTLSLSPTTPVPGEDVAVTGTGFTANSSYTVFFDDTSVASGLTSPAGDISTTFSAPAVPGGDYLVDVIDADGLVQVAVLRIPGPYYAVGGIAELPDVAQPSLETADSSPGSSSPPYAAIAGGIAAAAVALVAGAWYARRRLLR